VVSLEAIRVDLESNALPLAAFCHPGESRDPGKYGSFNPGPVPDIILTPLQLAAGSVTIREMKNDWEKNR